MIAKKFTEVLAISFLTIGSAIASVAPVTVGDLQISNFWAKAKTRQEGPNSAAYLVISNPKETGDKLIKVESDVATTMELHNHINENGVMKMRPVDFIAIDSKEVTMKPGGLHIMFMGLKEDLKEGASVKMTLTFEKAGKVQIDFPIKKPTA